MKAILANIALFDLVSYCKANNIDCSGTHLHKYPRLWRYALRKDETDKIILTVSYSKYSSPLYV